LSGSAAYRLRQLDRGGGFSYSDIVEFDFTEQSGSMNLECYPNPFNPSVQLRFTVPVDGEVLLRVFDSAGRGVETLYDGQAERGVVYNLTLNADKLATGVYFAVCDLQGNRVSRKMLLVR
jgi:hypothetical protein